MLIHIQKPALTLPPVICALNSWGRDSLSLTFQIRSIVFALHTSPRRCRGPFLDATDLDHLPHCWDVICRWSTLPIPSGALHLSGNRVPGTAERVRSEEQGRKQGPCRPQGGILRGAPCQAGACVTLYSPTSAFARPTAPTAFTEVGF